MTGIKIYNNNGLLFWNEQDIRLRQFFKDNVVSNVKEILLQTNHAWKFHEIESTCLIPKEYLNKNYTEEDVYFCDELVLRPETTSGSLEYAKFLLNNHMGIKLPLVVYSSGKSFRKEQDLVTKNMRLKEFYQLEFQCLFSADSKNDYYSNILEPMRTKIEKLLNMETRIIESERLPSYSKKTMDLEVMIPGFRFMEVCSISLRNDFGQLIYNKEVMNAEIAIGLDRLIHCWHNR